jgi:hypothetical protein
MFDASAFNFDAMKEAVGVDPFAEKANSYGKDERFFVLSKDKNGNGAALIRFLPDSERGMIQKLFKINTTIIKNDKKRFVSTYSPSTIGQPCPFQERWQELWNSGDKDGAKLFGRGIKYVANIKIIKDPANPENEGKIFLYEMSGAIKDKLQNALDPSPQDRSLGAKPKELFNPLAGNSFRLVAKRGANGQINYDSSEVLNEVDSIYDSVDDALDDIKNNTYKLSDLLKPESFMSYDQLCDKLNWVMFFENAPKPALTAEAAPAVVSEPEVVPAPSTATSTATSVSSASSASSASNESTAPSSAKKPESLDELLNGLV